MKIKRRPKNVLWVTVFLCSTIFEMDFNVPSAFTISSTAFLRREQRIKVNWIIRLTRLWNIITLIKLIPFRELHSAFNFGKCKITTSNVIKNETKIKILETANHNVSGWRKENENRWNFFVSESNSIRKGMNPISWQNQTNGRKFVSLSIALSGTKTSQRLSNTLLDTDEYYSYVSGHKYWNYFSCVQPINLTDGIFSLVAIVTATALSTSNKNSWFCFYDEWLFNRCVVCCANLAILLHHKLFLSFLFDR